MRTKELFAFIKERHNIYTKRQAGQPKPWTKDPILRSYRFCNVYRELDTVTKWIAQNWRDPAKYSKHQDLWFAMVVARLVNWPETLAEIGFPIAEVYGGPEFDGFNFLHVMHGRKQAGQKVFSGAYIVSTNGHKMDKAEYLCEYVLDPLWREREEIRPRKGDTLASFHARLSSFNGMGSFMAAQVVADVKYAKGSPLSKAEDWWTWAASGPGSRRGLNRVLGTHPDSPWKEADWLERITTLMGYLEPLVTRDGFLDRLHMQDLQNCLCEWDKFERTRLGEGRPRSTYQGA